MKLTIEISTKVKDAGQIIGELLFNAGFDVNSIHEEKE